MITSLIREFYYSARADTLIKDYRMASQDRYEGNVFATGPGGVVDFNKRRDIAGH